MILVHKISEKKSLLRKRTGFTLLEVLIVLALISILLGGAVFYTAGKEKESGKFAKSFERASQQLYQRSRILNQRSRVFVESGKIVFFLNKENRASIIIPEGIGLAYKYRLDDSWREMDESFEWLFSRSGVSEPLFLMVREGDEKQYYQIVPVTMKLENLSVSGFEKE